MTTPALPATTGPEKAGAVIPSIAFDALLARRDAAIAQLNAIAKAVREYQDVGAAIWAPEGDDGPRDLSAPYTFREPIDQRPSGRGAYLTDEKWLEHSIASIDAALWDHLLEESGLRSFMDQKAREDWRKQIEERATPPLTPDNVRATFAHLYAMRGELFERGVVGIFRSLSWDYKTNQPQKFGKRLVLRGVVDGYGHPNHHRTDSLDDLERAFHLLDGKPEPDHRSGVSSRLWQRKRENRGEDLIDPYLRIRTFKNGNAHVTMLRPELVDELNRILAKHYPSALPPAREAA